MEFSYNPAPEEPRELTRRERVVDAIRTRWEDRPDLFTMQYYYLPLAVIYAGFGIGLADETFHTHIAESMAEVRVNPNANFVERNLQALVRQIGKAGVQAEG
jgi:hypothetical protein